MLKEFVFLALFVVLSVKCQSKVGDSCVDDYTGTVGVCAPIQNCQSAKQASQGNGITPTFCAYSAFNPTTVCCLDDSSFLNVARPTEKPPVWSNGDTAKRLSDRKCEEYSRSVVSRVTYVPLNTGKHEIVSAKCDYLDTQLIIGGEKAKLGEFPHMAAIGWFVDERLMFPCGGALISPNFVLTAGHCQTFRNTPPVVIRLGEHNIDPAVNDGADPVDIPIKRMIPHPEYKPPLVYNDIALFEMASSAKLGNAIRPACLWSSPNFEGRAQALAIGWGVTNDDTKETAKELRKVSLSLLENNRCDALLKNFQRKTKWPGFKSSQMCAGELRGGKDTCQGDSGSPLQVVSKENQCIFHVVGVVSFGRYCAVKNSPGVFSRVSSYLDWIERTVWPGEN